MNCTFFDKTTTNTPPSPLVNTPGVLNFRHVHTYINGKVGYENAPADDISLPYVGKKPGGSDVGHLISLKQQSKAKPCLKKYKKKL